MNLRDYLRDHIKTKHTKQGLVKCNQSDCEKEITQRELNQKMNESQFKYTVQESL